ncbi:MAG TPA: hypothetical protein VLB00_15840, partial [Gemmatimonadales bacterium]|nr:hypothetical protein [Gemmatimonadales bacterium]
MRSFLRSWVLALGLVPLTSHVSHLTAQEPGSELTVTLLTYETGGLIFERFGHNAIWIRDSAKGT